jgi:hypothetical protein
MNNLPETPVSALRMLATTQTEIDRFSDGLIQSVKDGEVNPLEILVMLRAFDKVSKRVLSEIDENYLKEADKYPEKKFELFGASIEKAEVNTSYDYTVCCDPIFEERESAMSAAKTLVDERKEFLKSLKEPMTIVHEPTGEVITIRPPAKKSTSGLKVTIR